MPSRTQYEINKLRGEVSKDDKISNDNIKLLRDALTDTEIAIKELYSKEKNQEKKLINIDQLAQNALKHALEQHDKSRHLSRERQLFIEIPYQTDRSSGLYGLEFITSQISNSRYRFELPNDFLSPIKLELIYGYATGNNNNAVNDTKFTFYTYWGKIGSSATATANTDSNNIIKCLTTNANKYLSYTLAEDMLDDLEYDDILKIRCLRLGDAAEDTLIETIFIYGFLLTYKADM